MKRWFLAACLLAAGGGPAWGDYLVISGTAGQPRDPQGQPAQPGPGGVGPGGGFGGPTQPGGPKGPGGILGGPGTPLKGETESDAAVINAAVVVEIAPLSAQDLAKFEAGLPVAVAHRWGKSFVMAKTDYCQAKVVRAGGRPVPTLAEQYAAKSRDLIGKTGKDKPPADSVLQLAAWCLERGLLARFDEVMEQFTKDEASHPVAEAYRKVKADLTRPLKASSAASHGGLLKDYNSKQGQFYTVYYKARGQEPAEVRTRLARLDDSFLSVYYWFVLQGKPLAVPPERPAAVLALDEKEFLHLHEALAASPVVVDGFVARRQALAVFSAKRLDEGYAALDKLTRQYWTQVNRNDLLKTVTPQRLVPLQAAQGDQALPYKMATAALFMKALEADAERAGSSHDGTRQLLYASGLLPGTVAAPEWVQFGVGGFFETSLGAPWPTVGAPNNEYLPAFRELKKTKALEKTPAETLKRVVADGYFRQAALDDDPATLGKARATAWSLVYFLARKDKGPEGLRKYFGELLKMPRDLELDEDQLLLAFGRAFGLTDASGMRLDPNLVEQLANQWLQTLDITTLDQEELAKEIRKLTMPGQPQAGTPRGGKPGHGQPNPDFHPNPGGQPGPGGSAPNPGRPGYRPGPGGG